MEPWFDTVAKMFAEGIGTRRQTLRWVGGIIGGAMLGSLGLPTRGWGQVSRHCQRFCRKTYPGSGPRARRNREHCKAICTQCEQIGSEECLTPAADPTKPPVARCLCGEACCPVGQSCYGRSEAVGIEICCPKGTCCVSFSLDGSATVECCNSGEVCTFFAGCCPSELVCGADCCAPGEVCSHGACVTNHCLPSQVPCPHPVHPIIICCPADHVCAPEGPSACCPPEGYLCGGVCCTDAEDTYCCEAKGTVWCCPNDFYCCATGCQAIPCS